MVKQHKGLKLSNYAHGLVYMETTECMSFEQAQPRVQDVVNSVCAEVHLWGLAGAKKLTAHRASSSTMVSLV
uniref:Uncharacterized protein n=1 Tax=Arundo donax TaxID=35708 RepID=A0A0A9HL32_ARUDO